MTDQKLLINLTLDDLTRHPCWKHFMLDNIELVMPVDKKEISEDDQDDYIVLTEFILNDNTKCLGFSSPKDTSGLDYIQPVIVTSSGQLPLYFDSTENINLPDLIKRIMNKNIEQIFPLTFITLIKCDNTYHQVRINNFKLPVY